jgi:hypothetical protein
MCSAGCSAASCRVFQYRPKHQSAGFSRRSTGIRSAPPGARVQDGPGGLVVAGDGALVLMALRFPAHIGVWLAPKARVIHCSEQHRICCESVLALQIISETHGLRRGRWQRSVRPELL